jgi:hypothetical protein
MKMGGGWIILFVRYDDYEEELELLFASKRWKKWEKFLSNSLVP